MYAYAAWNVDASQILSRRELALVLAALKKRAARLPNVQMNLAIVRLACCCGLRASEIGGLRFSIRFAPHGHLDNATRLVEDQILTAHQPKRVAIGAIDAGSASLSSVSCDRAT